MLSKFISPLNCQRLNFASRQFQKKGTTTFISQTLWQIKYGISTEIIKKHQQQINKAMPSLAKQYPLTFEQKAILLNQPKMIQAIQIIEYGVNYKSGNKLLFIFLFFAGWFSYAHQKLLPQKVIDDYFAVSNEMNKGSKCGYILAAFTYENSFLAYLPLMAVVYQMSKFVKSSHMFMLFFVSSVINAIEAKYLVDERVKWYEVWDQQRIFYGQASLLSLGTGFWTMLGFQKGFTGLKAKINLKAIPGIGIIRAGIPIGYVLTAYITYFGIAKYHNSSNNSQLILLSVIISILWGLLMRRYTRFIPK